MTRSPDSGERRPALPVWLYITLAVFALASYAALQLPLRIESLARLHALSLVPLILGWVAFGMPIIAFCVVLYRAGADRYDGLWTLASITLLVAGIAGMLFRLGASLGIVPGVVVSTASPAGIVVSLLWTGWGSLDQKQSERSPGPLAPRVAVSIGTVAACVALALYSWPVIKNEPYWFALLGVQALLIVVNAFGARKEPLAFLAPLVCFGLGFAVRILSATVPGGWISAETSHLFSILAIVTLAAIPLARKGARA